MGKFYFQDGAQFYDEDTGECIVEYPEMVLNDSDTKGAQAARTRFLMEFPEYIRTVL